MHVCAKIKRSFSTNRIELLIVLILTVINIIFKLTLRSASLWIWDDVHFAYNVQHGILYAYTPGYPGYMTLGRITYLLYHSVTGVVLSEQPMILLSAILGGLLTLPVYFLIRNLLGKKLAVISTLFIMINPFVSRMSAQALSDIPSLFFVTLSIALFYFGLQKNNFKIFLFSAITYGFSVLIRPSNILTYPLFFVAIIIGKRSLHNSIRPIISFTLVALFPVLIGYAPLFFELGPAAFFNFVTKFHEVSSVNYTINTMTERTLFAAKDLIYWITPLAVIICLLGFYELFLRHRRLFYCISAWISTHLLFFLFYGQIHQLNRFCLPIYPAFSLLFAYALDRPTSKFIQMLREKSRNKKISGLALLGLLMFVFVSIIVSSLSTYGDLQYWSNHESTPKKFSIWINETVPQDSVVVAGEYCWVVKYHTNLPEPIWGSDSSWINYCVDKELRNGHHVFIVSEQLEKSRFLIENFTVENYADYDTELSLFEIKRALSPTEYTLILTVESTQLNYGDYISIHAFLTLDSSPVSDAKIQIVYRNPNDEDWDNLWWLPLTNAEGKTEYSQYVDPSWARVSGVEIKLRYWSQDNILLAESTSVSLLIEN